MAILTSKEEHRFTFRLEDFIWILRF